MRIAELARLSEPVPETTTVRKWRLLVMSDLHVDQAPILWPPEIPEFDAVVVAGDVSSDMATSLLWCAATRDAVGPGKPLVFVPGDADLSGPGPMRQLLKEAKIRAADLGIDLLSDTSIRLGSGAAPGLHLIGSTLWTDWSIAGPGTASHARAYARRFWPARDTELDHGRPLTPHDVAGLHARSHAYIEDALLAIVVRSTGFCSDPSPLVDDVRPGDRAVVISHHAPTGSSVPRELDNHGATPWRRSFVASNKEQLMQSWGAPVIWIHGHVPSPVDNRIGETRVVAAPLTPAGFSPLVIEV